MRHAGILPIAQRTPSYGLRNAARAVPECGMACAAHIVPSALNDWLIERRTTLQAAGLAVDGEAALHLLDGGLLASDFAFDALRRDPALWPLAQRTLPPPPLLAPPPTKPCPGQPPRH